MTWCPGALPKSLVLGVLVSSVLAHCLVPVVLVHCLVSWCMYCLVARCPGVLINGFRGEPEEAVASGWSYLGPHCTRLCHLHHLQHAATCADCFLISFRVNSKQLFNRPSHCVIQGGNRSLGEVWADKHFHFADLSFRFLCFLVNHMFICPNSK